MLRVVDRLRISVQKRSGVVLFRADVSRLGGSTQVGAALRALTNDGMLIRLGEGIYAKASRDSSGKVILAATIHVVLSEVLQKLGVDGNVVSTERDGAIERLVVDAPNRKIERHLEVGSVSIEIVTRHSMLKAPKLPEDPASLPRHHVRRYIERLAKWHRLTSNRTSLDRWAESVSRAAGDTVVLDSVGRLLAKLKQEHVINGRQMAHLMNNYVTERDRAKPGV